MQRKANQSAFHCFGRRLRRPMVTGSTLLEEVSRLYPTACQPARSMLFMALHSDRNGCNTNLFTLFSDAKARGTSVREHEQGVPFLYYNWNKYVHRNNPEEFINRGTYLTLDDEQKKQYKGVHNREIRTLFNIDQTTFPHVDEEAYRAVLQQDGNAMERGYSGGRHTGVCISASMISC